MTLVFYFDLLIIRDFYVNLHSDYRSLPYLSKLEVFFHGIGRDGLRRAEYGGVT